MQDSPHKTNPPVTTTSQTQNSLKSRPFVQQDSSHATLASGQGFNFADIGIVQPKLTRGKPHDKVEKHAVSSNSGADTKLHSQPANRPENKRIPLKPSLVIGQPIQRTGEIMSGPVEPEFETQLNQARSQGSALEPKLRGKLESATGANLQNIKVHTDTRADTLSQSIQAKAFTTGRDIFFRQGEYNPSSRSGQELIAHEVTHTLQQGATDPGNETTQRKIDPLSGLSSHIIQRVTENDPLTIPTGTSTGTAFNAIVTSVNSYNDETLHFEPASNVTDPDEITKSKLRRRISDLESLSTNIDTWMTNHPEIANTLTSRKKTRERRDEKRQNMQQLKTEVTTLLEHIQNELTLLITQIETEQAFENAPLQSNPDLRQGDELNHQIKEQNSVLYFLSGKAQAFFPLTQIALALGEDTRVHKCGDSNEPNKIVVKILEGNLNQQVAIVSKGDLIEIKTESERFEKVETALFPNDRDPDPNDVKQTNIGDCYLQAAVMSIATSRPQYFKTIMRDQGDTVAVRLHRVTQEQNEEKTFTPEYIKVEKSIPKSDDGRNLYNSGQLWVKMIQKAYAAGGFAGTLSKEEDVTSKSYDNIAGGYTSHALEVLTGQASDSISLENSTDNSLMGETNSIISKALDKNKIDSNSPMRTAIDDMIFRKYMANSALGGKLAVQVTLDEVGTVIDQNGTSSEQTKKDLILKDLEGSLPGKLGTGKYTLAQLTLFTTISEETDAGKPLAVGTHKYLEAEASGDQGFAGEQKEGGLAGGHAYSVLQTCTSNDITTPDLGNKDGKYRLIQLRNPWGKYGREYQYDYNDIDNEGNVAVKPKANRGAGVFWIELSELTKYFDRLDIGAKIPTN